MKIERKTAFAPRTQALGKQLVQMHEPCVGCEGCEGLCQALIEAMTLPDVVLSKGRDT